MNRLFHSKSEKSGELDKNSLRIIWITIIISVTSGVMSAMWLPNAITKFHWIRYLGALVVLAGILIRLISIFTLGKFFTVNLAIHESHRLIKKGFYKYVRHPSYSGSLLSFFGLGLSLNNWISLALIFVPVLLAFHNRIKIEEELLIQQIGTEYQEYKKLTKRLIPWIY